jgi:hypothetical protein
VQHELQAQRLQVPSLQLVLPLGLALLLLSSLKVWLSPQVLYLQLVLLELLSPLVPSLQLVLLQGLALLLSSLQVWLAQLER